MLKENVFQLFYAKLNDPDLLQKVELTYKLNIKWMLLYHASVLSKS